MKDVLKKTFTGLSALMILILSRAIFRWYRIRNYFAKKNAKLQDMMYEDGIFGKFFQVLDNYTRIYQYKQRIFEEKKTSTFALMFAFWNPQIIVSTTDPRNVKHILKDNYNNYIKSEKFMSMFKPLLGNGIFAANHGSHAEDKGELWYFQRKTASKMFTKKVFAGEMYSTLVQNSNKFVKLLSDENKIVDLQRVFAKFTLDNIGYMGFGVHLNTLDEEEDEKFATSFNDAQKHVAFRFFLPFAENFGTLLYESERKFEKNIKILDDFTYKVIDQRLNDTNLDEKYDILSFFIQELKKDEGKYQKRFPTLEEKREILRDVVMSFFIAGRDTTMANLSFLFYYLTQYPECQEKLYQEIITHLPDSTSPPPNLDQLKNGFPYLKACIIESLRLAPPVATDGKMAAEDDVLPDGTYIPKGTRVNFEVYCMGHNKNYWGNDAEEFNPDRWLGDNAAKPTSYEFPVFQASGSPRSCLGEASAKFTAQVIVCQLVRNYKFILKRSVNKPVYVPGVTLTVNGGVPVQAIKRLI